jgi:DNA-directed RNA polymerase subunit H (RpoH/RPB5)
MPANCGTDDAIRASWRTLMEMLRDRASHRPDGTQDYALADEALRELACFSPEDVASASKQSVALRFDAPSAGLRVVYYLATPFKSAALKKYIEAPPLEETRTVVVVVRDKPNTAALRGLSAPGANGADADVQLFSLEELQYNPSRNDLVPPHHPITDEATIAAILERHHAKAAQFPQILSSDAMARYFGLKPGQLVAITRVSPSCGTTIAYRSCLKARDV